MTKINLKQQKLVGNQTIIYKKKLLITYLMFNYLPLISTYISFVHGT